MFHNNKSNEFAEAFQAAGMGPPQYPFLYPTPYMPAQFGMQGNSDMGALIAMFAGPLMSAMAGPENFIPQLMPGQALMDQYAMRNYQREMLESSLATGDLTRGEVTKRILGLRSGLTSEPITQLNREQADNIAGIASHPIVKALAGSVFGAEAVEALLYGSKGDIQALNSAVAKTGFFRTDPMGGGRMKADTLTEYTQSVYSHLYEPEGNLDELEADARKGRGINPFRNRRIEKSRQKLKEIAGMPDVEIVSDEDVVDRLQNMENSTAEISRLYKKYRPKGSAVTTAEQAQELLTSPGAMREAGVLKTGEATLTQIRKEAEKAPVKRMHGFMGSQVGEMQQALFEQGLLPQSLGDMSAQERMKTVAETTRDDETIERLARRMAIQELQKDSTFKELSKEQQDRLIETKMPDAVKTLRQTEAEVGKFAAGDRKAMSIEELEKQGGMNLLTVDADAKRTGQTMEKYSGALASIRELFGDNGNPNAPVSALIKMMNALTNSTMGQFEPGKIEAELRKMQTLAKETGVGIQQLSAISQNVTAQGRMFGLNDATAVQATNATLAGLKVMRQEGEFATGRFGAMNQAQATDMLSKQIQAGAASNNAKAMAALARIYEAEPTKYAGTELEAAVKAYKDPNSGGRYTDPTTGEEKNLYETMGRRGPLAARQILSDSNKGDTSAFTPMFYDPLTEEYAQKLGGFMTQKTEGETFMRFTGVSPHMTRMLDLEENKGVLAGLDQKERKKTANTASKAVTRMLVDTATMSKEKRNQYFNDQLEVEIAQSLKDSGVEDAEAESRAKELAAVYSKPGAVDQLAAAASSNLHRKYGMTLIEFSQLMKKNEEIAIADAAAGDRAKAKAAASLGYESGPVQRMSDYFAELADSGDAMTVSGFMNAVMPTIKDEKVARKFMEKMEPGFKVLQKHMADVFVTDKYIDELAAAGNVDELKKLADPEGRYLKSDVKVISGRQLEKARDAAVKELFNDESGKLSAEKVDAAYAKHKMGSGKGLSTEEKLAELRRDSKSFLKEVDDEVYNNQQAVSIDRVVADAKGPMGAKGRAREGMQQQAEDLLKIQAAFYYGSDPEKMKQGVTSIFRTLGLNDVDEKDLREFQELTMDTSEEGKKKLDTKINDMWIGGFFQDEKKREELRGLLTAAQESAKMDPAALGITDDSGAMKQTADGVVDKTNIEAQTVVLNADRYVDKNGQPLFSETSARGTAIQQNEQIRKVAEKMVEEHYSDTGMMGNSTPFSDAEVKDAAVRLADTLGISQEDATAIMQSIQADKQKNMNASGIVSALYPDNLSYTKEKDARNQQTARDIIDTDYKGQKEFSRDDVETAAVKLAKSTGMSLPEAKAVVMNELEQKSVKVEKPEPKQTEASVGGRPDRPLPTLSIKGKPDEVPPGGLVPATEAERRKKYDYKKLGVKDSVTPEQQEIMDRVSTDPTGKRFAAEMSSVFGGKTREAMFTLPDAAAVELFNKFDPEARERGLRQLKDAKDNSMLTPSQRANAERLYDAISAAQTPDKQKIAQTAAVEQKQKKAIERDKEAVRQTTGIEYASVSKEDIERMLSDPAAREFFTAPETGGLHTGDRGRRDLPPSAMPDIAASDDRRARKTDRIAQHTQDVELYISRDLQAGRTTSNIEQMASQMSALVTGGQPAGGQDQNLKISGTLSLNGLQEVLLSARGQQSIPVEGGGAPVVIDPATMYTSPQGPRRSV